MISKELIDILVCPETQQRLTLADGQLLAEMNRAIGGGDLKNRDGQRVAKVLVGGLVREDRQLMYPIVDDIPVMLIDEAIPLDQVNLDA